jgi:two-component system, LuxR family, response regulator FixJ
MEQPTTGLCYRINGLFKIHSGLASFPGDLRLHETTTLVARITIIDDDEAVRDSMLALLESYGYEVCGFASAEDFLARSRDGADCLLVDQHMPGMKGLDLLEKLRAEGDGRPALMITARVDPAMEPRARRIGVRLLGKPVVEGELVSWIEDARSQPRSAQNESDFSSR